MGAPLAVNSLFRLIRTMVAILGHAHGSQGQRPNENSCYTPHSVTEIQSKGEVSLQPVCKLSI